MSPRRLKFLGVFIGIALAGVVLAVVGPMRAKVPAPGPMISECDGAIRSVVIQYVSGADFALPVYRQFLGQIDPGVKVYVVCPEQSAFEELTKAIGPVKCPLIPLYVNHAMTSWSRDRWVALRPVHPGEPTRLVYPREEAGAEGWAARAGDERIAQDLARLLDKQLIAQQSGLYFDGGDLIADENTVFVTPDVITRNVQQTVADARELVERLQRIVGRPVVLLEDAPRHHAGMFMMLVGSRTAIVGDPSLGRKYWSESYPALPGGPDFSQATQRLYDAVAQKVAAQGYRVVRIPIIPGSNGKTFLTHVNVIIDHREGKSIVYMPVYRGAEGLNQAAREVWEGLGYEVRPIDCTTTYSHFGNLHCLVNVLARG